MSVRVVTDSSAVLPAEWRSGIDVVPLTISFEDDTFVNGDLSYDEFARRIGKGAVPHTSAPSPGRYTEAYERALADADALFVLTPPAELSVTHSNATLAAKLVDADRIEVFDSRSAAGGQGLVALAAARTAEGGASLADVTARAHNVAGRVRLWATVERLDYLHRSGRVPAVAALAVGALDLHPVFRFVDGSPSPVAPARGAKRAAERVFRSWVESVPEAPARTHAVVFHAERDAEANGIRERIGSHGPPAETAVVQITAAMAAHLGPGVLGLAWWWEDQAT